jgi:hypothetical protein
MKVDLNNNQSVAPDGPSMPPPIKKETWVAGKQEGGAGRQSVVPAARLGTVQAGCRLFARDVPVAHVGLVQTDWVMG